MFYNTQLQIRRVRACVIRCIGFIADADNIPPKDKTRIIAAIHDDAVYQCGIDRINPELPCCVGSVEEAEQVRDEIVAVITAALGGHVPRIGTVSLQFG